MAYSKWYLFFREASFRDVFRVHKLRLLGSVRKRYYSFLSYSRLSKIYDMALLVEEEAIHGDFVECGVCRGGSAGVLSKIAERNSTRHVWLFDSWEGLPQPTEIDVDFAGTSGYKGQAYSPEQTAREFLFEKLALDEQRIHLVKGWFQDTLPSYKHEIGEIALLHLDSDWYESTKLCLEELYDSVVEGGVIVIDDYWFWQGCRKAVDEFLAKHNLVVDVHRVDIAAVFRKPSQTHRSRT